MYQQKASLFKITDNKIRDFIRQLWAKIRTNNRLNINLYDATNRTVNMDTLQHSNVREIGAEWCCYNTWQQLDIDTILRQNNFTEDEIKLAQTQVISRAIYPFSELATSRWVTENSAITALTGYDINKVNKDRLYSGALQLNTVHEQLQNHLSIKTNGAEVVLKSIK
jgi:hypothetical protein